MQQNDLISHFSIIRDPRIDRTKHHRLIDIIVITLCAVIAGADNWIDISEFGEAKEKWFKTFLKLPNSIPSHDTFRRVFILLDPNELRDSFISWIRSVSKKTKSHLISIDGKTSRRSSRNGKGALHMVSAWSHEAALVLGQIKTNEKSNEITAIPQLLDILDLTGCIVSIDAMGTQKNIAKKIKDKKADYVLALKGNHPVPFKEITDFFSYESKNNFNDIEHDYYETIEKDHGRIETRRYWITSDIDWFADKPLWSGLKCFGFVEATRTIGNKTSSERRYYLTSLKPDAKQFAHAVRGHWSIENSLHWVLDVVFRDDDNRSHVGHAPENLAIIRHLALNLIKSDTSKGSMRVKRNRAAWNNNFLASLLKKI